VQQQRAQRVHARHFPVAAALLLLLLIIVFVLARETSTVAAAATPEALIASTDGRWLGSCLEHILYKAPAARAKHNMLAASMMSLNNPNKGLHMVNDKAGIYTKPRGGTWLKKRGFNITHGE